jgi:hypothetical protein
MAPSWERGNPDPMDFVSIAIALVAFVVFYVLVDGLDRV